MNISEYVPTTQENMRRLAHNRWTGVLTREALELLLEGMDCTGMAAVIWDVDNLKAANNQWTKPVCSAKMRNAARASGIELTAHLFSGDEYISIVCMDDATGLANRVQERFKAEGMTATFVILEIFSNGDLWDYVGSMDETLNQIKQGGYRGSINDYRPDC